MTLTAEQTALVTRAKALVDANPNDHTSTMELVRGLIGIVEAQADELHTLTADECIICFEPHHNTTPLCDECNKRYVAVETARNVITYFELPDKVE